SPAFAAAPPQPSRTPATPGRGNDRESPRGRIPARRAAVPTPSGRRVASRRASLPTVVLRHGRAGARDALRSAPGSAALALPAGPDQRPPHRGRGRDAQGPDARRPGHPPDGDRGTPRRDAPDGVRHLSRLPRDPAGGTPRRTRE